MPAIPAGAGGDLPLAGLRVLAVEQYGAGPYCTMYLADLGAEVIKIEPPPGDRGPGGDNARQSGPHFLGDNDSLFFQTFNINKKSVALDLRRPAGQEAFRRLAGTADAVMNNLRGDQPDKLGLTHTALAEVNPRLVCLHLSGYGRTGPRAAWPAYDYLLQAEAGFMALTGEPDGPPARFGLSMVDYMTGMTAAFALTAAMFGAWRTGRGRDVDVTLYDVAMHQLTYPATWYLNAGSRTDRRPRSGHPSVVPCELYPTRDGWLMVMCILPKFWRALCDGVGRPELIEDPRFVGPAERRANRDALAEILDEAFAERTTAQWMGAFAGTVPVAPVLDVPQALDNPYFRDSGGVLRVGHPDNPDLTVVANPVRLDGQVLDGRPCSALGADTEALLREVAYGDVELAALRRDGVIAP